MFAYIDVTQWARYLEIAEELNVAILEAIRAANVTVAAPFSELLRAGKD